MSKTNLDWINSQGLADAGVESAIYTKRAEAIKKLAAAHEDLDAKRAQVEACLHALREAGEVR